MKKRILLLLVLSFASVMLFAQAAPDWWESSSRAVHYPKDIWFTGFVLGGQLPGESIENACERLKNEARVEAASSVKTSVQKEMLSSNCSEMIQTGADFDERVTEVFRSNTHIEVNLQIPGLKVDIWQNPQTKEIGAFAFVRQREVEKKTEKQITALLSKLEMILQSTNRLIASGQKMEARKTAESTLPVFAEIEELQKLLISLSDDVETLQLNETQALRSQFVEQLAYLKHGVVIYIAAKCTLFDEKYGTLYREVTGQLSTIGCEFANSAEDADWTIYIESSAREYNKADFGGVSVYTAYADVILTIDKSVTRQRIYSNEIHRKATHTLSYKEAARQAYEEVTGQVCSIIKEQIQE